MTGTNQVSICPDGRLVLVTEWVFPLGLTGALCTTIWERIGSNLQRRPQNSGPMLVYWNDVFESNICGMTVLRVKALVHNSSWTEPKRLHWWHNTALFWSLHWKSHPSFGWNYETLTSEDKEMFALESADKNYMAHVSNSKQDLQPAFLSKSRIQEKERC